ncbi:hypothetical protein QBC32DRAFT_325231 [Pseudoneurospora amorphoporcata]|uniref:Myb-like DNA-binding domain-containing protein n=1 Tax=Pseudoneurospora amorphoporcata TaxID=241081 RepID=A0AAN6NT07_9PEZI|nr:hypothetical protein QBC32DRAFT_325231 [Pseudoneurospora amorphoporcata]
MPPKANQDVAGQMNFLLCCIKHSSNGKINWSEVAGELSIVSKAAAAKRYERLLKAHDIQPPKNYGSLTDDAGPSGAGSSGTSSPAQAKTPKTPRAPRSTKRKRATAAIDNNEDSSKEGSAGEQHEPFTYKAEPEDSDDDEKQRPLKKEKTTPDVETKQEEGEDGVREKGYDVLMDVVVRIEGKDNYKYEGEI